MAANRITDVNELSRGLVWVLLKYEDGSEFCFQTTTNQRILDDNGIILEEGKMVRLDKRYLVQGDMIYRQFEYTNAKVSLWDAEHYTDRNSAFLSQFL